MHYMPDSELAFVEYFSFNMLSGSCWMSLSTEFLLGLWQHQSQVLAEETHI